MYILTENDFLDQEEWRPVKDHPTYFVSNFGRVYHNTNNGKRLLKPYDNSTGYLVLRIDGKYYLLHRLVAEAFLNNPEGKKCVDHINAIRYDCRASNLRWATHKENSSFVKDKYKPKDIRSCKQVRCVETGQVFDSQKEAADYFGVSKTMLWYATRSENHTCLGYHFEYTNNQAKSEYIHF